jgi:hypothetical protein
MGWLIAGLLVLLLIGGLIGFSRVREHDRQPADDTLLAELLGEDVSQPPPPAVPSPPPVAPSPPPVAPSPPPAAPSPPPFAPPQSPALAAPDDTEVLPPVRTTDGTEILPVVPAPQAAEVPPAPEAPAETQPPARPAPVEAPDEPAPETHAPEAHPAEAHADDGDWLESQLAWIRNWSQRMQDQIDSGSGQGPDRQD